MINSIDCESVRVEKAAHTETADSTAELTLVAWSGLGVDSDALESAAACGPGEVNDSGVWSSKF